MMSTHARIAATIASLVLASGGASVAAKEGKADLAGWKLADIGHKPGDDSNRLVSIEKDIPQVDMSYRPGGSGKGGSLQATFRDPGCSALNLSAGFDLPAASADRVAVVRSQIHEAFGDFAKTCKRAVSAEPLLMAGFDKAFAAVDKLMRDKPFVHPAASADGTSQ